jgi:hypothetical protein
LILDQNDEVINLNNIKANIMIMRILQEIRKDEKKEDEFK